MSTIIIADDHELIRNGIKSVIGNNPNLKLLGEASNGQQAWDLTQQYNPDILLIDISMPKMNGIDVAKKIMEVDLPTKIIFLTMYDGYEYINKCLELGVSGYLVKSDVGQELIQAIDAVSEGGKFFSEKVHKAVMENYTSMAANKKSNASDLNISLTNRELEVVKLVAKGLTSSVIAEKLFVSPRTVDTHRANLMKKLKVKNSAQLVSKIQELDLFKDEAST